MKIRFYLADKAANRTSIVLTVREGATGHNLKTLRLGTGITIDTKAWNAERERLKRNHADSSRLNRELDDIAAKVQDLADIATRLLRTDPLPYIKSELPKAGVLERPVPTQQVPAPASVLHYFKQRKQCSCFPCRSSLKRGRFFVRRLKQTSVWPN